MIPAGNDLRARSESYILTLGDPINLFPQVEGDKKARQDAEAKRIESKGKKDLLETALKRYKTLDIMGGVFDDEEGTSAFPACRILRGLRYLGVNNSSSSAYDR